MSKEEDEDEEERFDVKHFVGQSLFKCPQQNSLKQQARLLTGAPLIKGGGDVYQIIQQQHIIAFYRHSWQRTQECLEKTQPDKPCLTQPEQQDDFQPRILRPRRRRKVKEKKCDHNLQEESAKLELDLEDEMHLLPTDLLSDENQTTTDLTVGHPVLRKTFSWASPPSETPQEPQHLKLTSSFSLFPQTSQSDLLCSVRNNLLSCDIQQTMGMLKNTSSNLEQALKSLSIDSGETSISRKF